MNLASNSVQRSPAGPDKTATTSSTFALRTFRTVPLRVIVILAILTGTLYFLHFRSFYEPDSSSYITPANNLLTGHGFTGADARPETVRTPGYPLLILPFLWSKLDLKWLVIFQHFLRVLIILATSAFMLYLTGSRRQAFLAGIFLCIDLPLLEATNTILTEIPYTAILLVVLWLLWVASQKGGEGWIYLAGSGLLAGMSALVRPVSLFLFVPVTIYLLLSQQRKTRAALAFILAFSLFPLTWSIRNYRQTGYFTLSSITGTNMLLYRAAGILAIHDPGDFNANLRLRQTELKNRACEDLRRLTRQECSTVSAPQQSDCYARLGEKIVVENPGSYIRLAARAAAVMMLDGGPTSLEGITGIRQTVGIRLLLIYTAPFLCLTLIGLLRFWKQNRQLFYLFLLIVAYFVTISAGAEAYSRLRVPIDPLCTILAAVGMNTVIIFLMDLRKTYSSRTVT